MKTKELLSEMPFLNREELQFKALSNISLTRLQTSYDQIGEIGDLGVYQHVQNGNIIAARVIDKEVYILVSISTRAVPYQVQPTQLGDVRQVSMVHITKGEEEQGLTKRVYALVSQLFDLVSDHEQYLGAQGIWKSLARNSNSNVYVFDGRRGDYIRGENGRPLKNGKNIHDDDIWGQRIDDRVVLLVATVKELI